MKPSNEQQQTEIYGDPVHERHVYLLKQKKTADDDGPLVGSLVTSNCSCRVIGRPYAPPCQPPRPPQY